MRYDEAYTDWGVEQGSYYTTIFVNGTAWPFTREEVESLIKDLQDAMDPPKNLVTVSVIGVTNTTYTYEDPSGELQVDDLVRVPFGHSNVTKVAIVRSLSSPYQGEVKSVLAKFTAEEL